MTPPVLLLPLAEADHSLLKRLNLIDLSLSQEALEEQLLSEVLHAERPEILKNQQVLYLGILQLEGKLEATEVIPGMHLFRRLAGLPFFEHSAGSTQP